MNSQSLKDPQIFLKSWKKQVSLEVSC